MTNPLPKDETAVLQFLQANPGTKYIAEEVGRAVRQLLAGKELLLEGRLARNWANTRLNSLHRQGLIHKEGKKGHGATMKWWVA